MSNLFGLVCLSSCSAQLLLYILFSSSFFSSFPSEARMWANLVTVLRINQLFCSNWPNCLIIHCNHTEPPWRAAEGKKKIRNKIQQINVRLFSFFYKNRWLLFELCFCELRSLWQWRSQPPFFFFLPTIVISNNSTSTRCTLPAEPAKLGIRNKLKNQKLPWAPGWLHPGAQARYRFLSAEPLRLFLHLYLLAPVWLLM